MADIEFKYKTRATTRRLVYGGVLTCIGVVLPLVFHFLGGNSGMVFLPMHLPVLLAGILLGPLYGGAVGLLSILLSFLITNMPPVPKLWFMIFELLAYGAVSGLLSRRVNVYFTLILSMLAGRIVYGLALIIGVRIFAVQAAFANAAAFWAGLITGIPGVIIQLVIIPVLYFTLKKGGLLIDE